MKRPWKVGDICWIKAKVNSVMEHRVEVVAIDAPDYLDGYFMDIKRLHRHRPSKKQEGGK